MITTEISGNVKKISLARLFYNLSFILCLFPYAIRLTDRDLQPLCFIVLGICLALSLRAKTSSYWILLLISGFLIIIYRLRLDYELIEIIRSFPIYLTPILILRFFDASLSTKSFIFSAIRSAI